MEFSAISLVGFGALGLLVVLWLVVSFSQPGLARTRLEWLAATCLYVALSMLFLSLVLAAIADDAILRLVAFGFLLLVFGIGGCVSAYNTLRSFGGGGGSAEQGATH